MFKKIMAKLGVGVSKVDLLLDDEHCRLGDELRGKVLIEGGDVDQEIHDIKVDVVMRIIQKGKKIEKTLDTIKVADELTVNKKSRTELPFNYLLPLDYPVSKNGISYYLKTTMDIAKAVDAFDSDVVSILPSVEMDRVFKSLEELGFKEKHDSGEIDQYGQEFEYYPPVELSDKLKEVELRFYHTLEKELTIIWVLEMIDGREYFAEQLLKSSLFLHHTDVKDAIKDFLTSALRGVDSSDFITMHAKDKLKAFKAKKGMGGFVGGLAAGVIGVVLLDEFMEDMFEDIGEDIIGEDTAEIIETDFGDF